MTAFTRRSYAGGAVQARLNANITDSDVSIVLAASPGYAGWPTGSGGPFYIAVDRGEASDGHSEEKILVASRSGATLTLAGTGSRGADGTSAAAHTAGVTVEHIGTATDLDEASAHHTDVTRDDHTQYSRKAQNLADLADLPTARSNLGLGAMALKAAIASADITDGTIVNADLANMANATVKGRNTAGTGVPEDVTMAQLRTLLALVIGTNVQAWDTDLDALAGLTYTTDKIAYFTGAHAAATTTLSSFMRTLLDDADAATALGTLGLTSAWTTYTPTNTGITVGNGTQSAAYRLVGKTCHVRWNLVWGSTTSYVAAPKFGLPFAAAATQVGSALCRDVSAGNEYPSTCYVLDTSPSLGNFATEGHTTVGGATPFGWATSDTITAQLTYETT